MPKVSVCIPCYKNVHFMKRCVASVLAQTYKHYELIITDDSPNNDVENFIATLDKSLPIKYYKNQPSLGSPKNWNYCISLAKGEYIKLLHYDDELAQPDVLEKMAGILDENNATNFVIAGSVAIAENEKTIFIATEKTIKDVRENPAILIAGNVLGAPSATMHRKTNLTYDEQFKWVVDFDFYYRFIKQHDGLYYLPEPLINTYISDEQITNSCITDTSLILFENLTLYRKFTLSEKLSFKVQMALLNIIGYYDIKSIKTIRDAKYNESVPFICYVGILYNNIFKRN